MDLKLAGKTAFVTAGAQGIGSAIATRLAAEGARVAIADLSDEHLQAGADQWRGDGGEPVLVQADLSTGQGVSDSVEAVVAGLGGPPDLLVNNVGVAISRPFLEIDDTAWDTTFQLNFMSYVRVCRALLPAMAGKPGSAVVNISSDMAKQPDTVPADYGAMKSAILYLTKSLSMEFAPAVRINAVLPGPVWTGLWSREGGVIDRLAELYGTDRDSALEKYLNDRQMTMGFTNPDDVGAMVAFLLSPMAGKVNGSSFDVGGTIRGLF